MNAIAAFVVGCVFLSFAVVSCWGSPPTEPQFGQGEMTIMRVPLEIKKLSVEIAETPNQLQYGLMFRKEMADDHGMIFVFPETQQISMWMKNTFLPLDMVFFDEAQRIIAIHENAKPHDETRIAPDVKGKYVLEINAGLAKKWDLQIGDQFLLSRR
ncbi:MAG TPA: hypothetical protein DIS76_04830 [Rhodospirillaceae bacterium]|nr:hypothetical protein [Rhodospirillaceae bacterium]